MDLGIRGRVAVVTAASRGLGLATARALAVEGADVAICARGGDDLRTALDELAALGAGRVFGRVVDVADPSALSGFLDAVAVEVAPVDILVTNVGGPPAGAFAAHDLEAWDAAWRSSFVPIVAAIRAVAPGMRRRNWGRIVNITSIAAKQPVDDLVLSNSLRAGVSGLARSLATEFAKEGVTVNNVLPGYTRTARVDALAVHAVKSGGTIKSVMARWIDEIPMSRLGEPDEIAATVAFLCSDLAAYVTGQSIAVDGGWIRGH